MTDASKRSRVQGGVPQGGEFATEQRDENADLTAEPEGYITDNSAPEGFGQVSFDLDEPDETADPRTRDEMEADRQRVFSANIGTPRGGQYVAIPDYRGDKVPTAFQQPPTAQAPTTPLGSADASVDETDPHIAAIYASIDRFYTEQAERSSADAFEDTMRVGWMKLELRELKKRGLDLTPPEFERKAFITGEIAYEEQMRRPLTGSRGLIDGTECVQQLKDIEKRRAVLNKRIFRGRRTRALLSELDVFEAETAGQMRALAQKMRGAASEG